MVVFELRFGAASHPDANRRRRLKDALDRLMDQLIQERVAPLDGHAAQRAAMLAAEGKERGRPVDLCNTLIAGIALAQEARLATGNGRHFDDTTVVLINLFPS